MHAACALARLHAPKLARTTRASLQERYEASYSECPRLTAIVAAVAAHPAVGAWEARRSAAAAAAAAVAS